MAECTLPILLKHIKVAPENVTVMDFEDQAGEARASGPPRASASCATGSPRRTWARSSGSTSRRGDLLIDLAWNIDACEILQWCHDHGVLYINTSVEVWDPYAGGRSSTRPRRRSTGGT